MDNFQAVIERVLQESENRRAARLQAIIQAGGTEAFLRQARMPRLASALAEAAPESIVAYSDGDLACMEERLRDCGRCQAGEMCEAIGDRIDRDLYGAPRLGERTYRPGQYPACEGGWLTWADCDKWPQYVLRIKLECCGVGKRYLGCSLDNFKPRTKAQGRIIEHLRQYAASLPTERGLFIAGPVGTGKTHLAVAVLREAIAKGMSGAFGTVPAVLGRIRAAIGRGDDDAARLLEHYQEVRLLVLDDLGSERVTDWVREQLFVLVDARYQAMLPTVVTTNDTLEDLEEYVGPRIVSRIMDMCDGIALDGSDYRKGAVAS